MLFSLTPMWVEWYAGGSILDYSIWPGRGGGRLYADRGRSTRIAFIAIELIGRHETVVLGDA